MFIKEGVKNSYFYMAPLKTKKSCLKCHAKQGYNEGEVRGGISNITFRYENTIFFSIIGTYCNRICRLIWHRYCRKKLKQGP